MKSSWLKIKKQVLGEKYDLSVFFLGDGEMKRLNSVYRKKNYAANVLSFPLSKNEGEILINKKYQKKDYGTYLFIHSLLHLKGLKHGKKMDNEELKIMKIIYPETYSRIMHSS